MDPEQNIRDQREALEEGDLERVRELREYLEDWGMRGGWIPSEVDGLPVTTAEAVVKTS